MIWATSRSPDAWRRLWFKTFVMSRHNINLGWIIYPTEGDASSIVIGGCREEIVEWMSFDEDTVLEFIECPLLGGGWNFGPWWWLPWWRRHHCCNEFLCGRSILYYLVVLCACNVRLKLSCCGARGARADSSVSFWEGMAGKPEADSSTFFWQAQQSKKIFGGEGAPKERQKLAREAPSSWWQGGFRKGKSFMQTRSCVPHN